MPLVYYKLEKNRTVKRESVVSVIEKMQGVKGIQRIIYIWKLKILKLQRSIRNFIAVKRARLKAL